MKLREDYYPRWKVFNIERKKWINEMKKKWDKTAWWNKYGLKNTLITIGIDCFTSG